MRNPFREKYGSTKLLLFVDTYFYFEAGQTSLFLKFAPVREIEVYIIFTMFIRLSVELFDL